MRPLLGISCSCNRDASQGCVPIWRLSWGRVHFPVITAVGSIQILGIVAYIFFFPVVVQRPPSAPALESLAT